jgi:hypothetical protein
MLKSSYVPNQIAHIKKEANMTTIRVKGKKALYMKKFLLHT